MESQNQEQVERVVDTATTDLYHTESLLLTLAESCPQTGEEAHIGPALKAVAGLVGRISADLAVLL